MNVETAAHAFFLSSSIAIIIIIIIIMKGGECSIDLALALFIVKNKQGGIESMTNRMIFSWCRR